MNKTTQLSSYNAGENIYAKSIKIVESLVEGNNHFNAYSYLEKQIVKRVIHATSDISYAETVFFTNDSAEKTIKLLKEKTAKKEPLKIVCDSEMTRAGISKNVNRDVILDLNCYINSTKMFPSIEETKSAFSIKLAVNEIFPDIIVIGNAPTALIAAMEHCGNLYKTTDYRPSLIIGMPVGFIGAAESKIKLYENDFFNAIGNFGNSGGSSSAAAVMNALLRESL